MGTAPYTNDNQIDSRKYIVGTSITPAFVITSLRSDEVANSLAFFVSVVSKTMTISFCHQRNEGPVDYSNQPPPALLCANRMRDATCRNRSPCDE